MSDLFISPERKISRIKNTGIQYIPGHTEPLVDLIINNYLPDDNGNILDLGGGGLRFAIPVASLHKKITVVDMDVSSVDIDLVFSRMKKNGLSDYNDISILEKKILIIVDDIFHFLSKTHKNYSLITALRLIHFFNEEETDHFFMLISKRLKKNGKLIISAFSKYNDDNLTNNEIFTYSKPFNRNIYYRKFNKNITTKKIQKEQNLGPLVHLFSDNYIKKYSMKYDLKLLKTNLPSTRIVRGYIFTK